MMILDSSARQTAIFRALLRLLVPMCVILIAQTALFAEFPSALKPEVNYRPLDSFLQDNNSDAEKEEFVTVKDSVMWTSPITTTPEFWHFWKEIWTGNDRSYLASQYALNNDKIDFVSRFHFLWGYETAFVNKKNYGFLHMLYRNQAIINKHWYIYGESWFGDYFGDLDTAEAHSPLLDTWHKGQDGLLANQNFTGGIQYYNDWFNAELGRGRFSIGNNISSSIILSDQTNDYAFTKLEMMLGKVNFTLLNGSLMADSTIAIPGNPMLSEKNYPDKYLSVHYMSWPMWERLRVSFGDIAVYGNRSFDWNYLFPHSFVRVIERNQHDRDNLLMFMTGEWKPTDDLLLYGQFVLDELIVDKIATDWWGNKYGLQGGVNYHLPQVFAKADAPQISAEITAIRPWTYTHKFSFTTYSHDSRCLGYQYGTNLVSYAGRWILPLDKWSDITGYYLLNRQGEDYNHYNYNYETEIENHDTEMTHWLRNPVNHYRIEHSLKIHPWAHQRFRITHKLLKDGDTGWENELSIAWQMMI